MRNAQALTIVGLLLIGACSSDGSTADAGTSGSTTVSTQIEGVDGQGIESQGVQSQGVGRESTNDTLASSANPGSISSDAEPGLLHDIGWIDEVRTDSDGYVFVSFDRAQIWINNEVASGLDLQEEPLLGSFDDRPLENESPQLRTYPLADGHEVLVTDPVWLVEAENGSNCSDAIEPVRWVAGELHDNEVVGTWPLPVALTFNPQGAVTRLRFMQACVADPTAVVSSGAESGLQFDLGDITGFSSEDGTTSILFDRYQGYTEAGELTSAPNLSQEFIQLPTTDFPFVNENPTLRRYLVAPEVKILITDPVWLAGQDDICGGDESELTNPIRWVTSNLTSTGPVASLTFGPSGEVTLIRYMSSC